METRQELVHRVYDLVEGGHVDKAVLVCLRLARANGDTFNAVMFMRELYPDVAQLRAAFREETEHLNDEARQQLWKITQDRWIEERTLAHAVLPGEEDRNVFAMGAGELCRDIEQMEKSIEDLRLPPGLGEYDAAAFTDRHLSLKSQMRLRIRACHEVLERVRTRCQYYASRVDAQLAAEIRTSDLVASVQREVHNFYAERCDLVYSGLHKAASLVSSDDPEDRALALTSIRRAVKAAADYHYPPVEKPAQCSDGKIRDLGEEQYLNRPQEFCAGLFGAGSSASLVAAEVAYLSVFLRRLNDVACKGVHSQVSPLEARQGLLGVYMFLSNVIAKLTRATGPCEP